MSDKAKRICYHSTVNTLSQTSSYTVQNSLHWEHPPIQIWQVTDTKAKGNNNKKQSFGNDKKSKCTHPSLWPWKFQSWNLGNCICFSFLVNSCSASLSNRKSKWIEVIGLKYILERPWPNDFKRSNRKYKEQYIYSYKDIKGKERQPFFGPDVQKEDYIYFTKFHLGQTAHLIKPVFHFDQMFHVNQVACHPTDVNVVVISCNIFKWKLFT